MQGILGHSKADTTVAICMQLIRGERQIEARNDILGADSEAEDGGRRVKFREKIGTLCYGGFEMDHK